MIEPAEVSGLLVEAAGLHDAVDAVVQTADDSWTVRLDTVDVEVARDLDRDRLVLLSTIGVPEPDRRLPILEAAMAYNFLLRETGGVRLATSGVSGDIVMMVDIAFAGLTPGQLAVVLANVAEKTLVWRAFVASGGSDTEISVGDLAGMITMRA